MSLDYAKCRQLLDRCNLDALFIECLGWDRHNASVTVATKAGTVRLRGFAQKRGFAAYVAEPDERGRIPDSQTRAVVDREVTKISREHIIIFSDGKSEQAWLWVRRTKGRPTRFRVYRWRKGQLSGTLLERVLPSIVFSLAEEEKLTLPDVTTRAGAAFDVERVTKRFYERFQAEHEAFHGFIEGIRGVADREWYASVMLNRLMFCYFIQKKGLLDGDHDYLRNRLARLQQSKGKDQFWSFYRHFLLRLFHEGLGQKRSSREKSLDALVGRIPYLNGGLFDVHELERTYPEIQIPDDAFERLFAFFDEFRWHLDERPLHESNEINPDVLGYIFEKYINQKQMGAYYTKEDITGYISQNTILPFVLDRAARDCAIAFAPDSTASVWRLLRHDPDAYIYEPVRHGVVDEKGEIIPLPKEIEAGTTDVAKRGAWNKAAPAPYGLPTETWREHVARRERCLELRRALAAGEVTTVNDLVTLNLDIRQFVEDVIDRCEGPELLRAVWRCLVGNVSTTSVEQHEPGLAVLDPTCGSGAFLFAALNILEPLYDACLDRMESFLEDLDRAKAAGDNVDLRKFADFKATLAQVAVHPNQRYYILKSIIVNNLYGVDIMEEACEICKLRLFLKLVAQVDEGVGGIEKIEPLPDIDFNIRAGNTLVGFTTLDAVRASMEGRFDFGSDLARIEKQAAEAADTFREFRAMQTRRNVEQRDLAEGKRLVRERLRALDGELNGYLASEYGVDPDKPTKFNAWLQCHQPFHWLVHFYGIMSRGGFDVIIGNPPWIEYAKVRKTYQVRGLTTERCGNLHGMCTERCLSLQTDGGRMSFIVQLPLVSSSRMKVVRKALVNMSGDLWIAAFDDRPGKLFDGLQHCRATIFLARRSGIGECREVAVTRYQRWPTAARGNLFATLRFVAVPTAPWPIDCFPKIANAEHVHLLGLLAKASPFGLGHATAKRPDAPFVFYQEATQYWVKATVGVPYYRKNGAKGAPAHGRSIHFDSIDRAHAASAVMNSSLFYLFYVTFSDCFHLSDTVVGAFPIPSAFLDDSTLARLGRELQSDLDRNAVRKTIATRAGDAIQYAEFFCSKSRPLIDQIDGQLAVLYGLTNRELDVVLGYDASLRDTERDESREDADCA